MRKKITVILAFIMAFAYCAGCGDPPPAPLPPPEFYEYDAVHATPTDRMKFYSSDNSLDKFLNEFTERHMRYDDLRIHTHAVGAGGSAWKEWEGIIGSWWDATDNTLSAGYGTKDMVTAWLLNPKQDNTGYIWADDGSSAASWGMGWAFPDYEDSGLGYTQADVDAFSGSAGTSVSAEDGCIAGTASGVSEISVETPDTEGYSAFMMPFIKTGWSFTNSGAAANLDDLYVYYQTESQPTYSEERKVKYSDFCVTGAPVTGNVAYNMACFPMYLQTGWGRSEDNCIKRVKFSMKAKAGQKISGTLKFEYIRMESDDRQLNNVGNYINAAYSMLSYAQNKSLTERILPKARAAMQHYLTVTGGESGLVSTENYVGHNNDGTKAPGTGISDGYWDVMSFPDKNMYINLCFYRALKSMIGLEELAATLGVTCDATTISDISGDRATKKVPYAQTAESLEALKEKTEKDFRSYFWYEKRGRFIAGYYNESQTRVQDNGYVNFNLEAVAAGLATSEQESQILSWIQGERKITGDDSTGKDIYTYDFAPRNTTKHTARDYVWFYPGCSFGSGVHNGGAVMQTSYYDLIARNRVLGADNAFERLKGIQSWYEDVQAAGGKGQQFYREYYSQAGISMQGGETGGAVGLDTEFLEAALMFSAIPEAFFGISPGTDKTMNVVPSMPEELDYWRIENVVFADYFCDVSVGKYFTQISNVHNRGMSSFELEGYSIRVSFDKPYFDYKVLYNGQPVEVTESGDKIVITVPFANGKIQIAERGDAV